MSDARERLDEMRETKAQIEIYEKSSGKVVDHIEKFYDEALRVAKSKISGKPHLGYRVIKTM